MLASAILDIGFTVMKIMLNDKNGTYSKFRTSYTKNKAIYKRIILIIAGGALGMFFLWLTFRDISLVDLVNGISRMNILYLLPSVILRMACQLVRAVRFGAILSPFFSLNIKSLWDLVNIWDAANMILPARLGELVRPYLLQQKGASFASVFGAVLVERFFDSSALLLLLGLVLWSSPNTPPIFSLLGKILLFFLAAGYIAVLTILLKRDKAISYLHKLLSFFPERLGKFIEGAFVRLIDGLAIMASLKQVIIIFLYSAVLWSFFSAITYLFLLAFSIDVPFFVAVTIQVLITLGVALPAAPGFVGTFHAAGRYALAMFGIGALVAVSFATVYHLFNLLLILLLGLVSYASSDFRINRRHLLSVSESPA